MTKEDIKNDLFRLLMEVENVIEIGDWKIDGRADPTMMIEYLKSKYGEEYSEHKKPELVEWA